VPAVCLNAIALRIQSGRYRPAPLNPPIVPQADLLRSDTQRPDVVTRVSTTACGIRGRSLVKCWSGAGRSKKIGPFDPGARQRYTPRFCESGVSHEGPPARGLVLLGLKFNSAQARARPTFQPTFRSSVEDPAAASTGARRMGFVPALANPQRADRLGLPQQTRGSRRSFQRSHWCRRGPGFARRLNRSVASASTWVGKAVRAEG
jgi:hypothetical protein